MRKTPYFWLAMAASLLIFMLLLALRLDLFNRPEPMTPVPAGRQAAAEDAWMEIYQGRQKIGFSHRRFAPTAEGFHLSDETFLRLNTMGMVQDVRLHTEGRLRRDMSLATFDFQLRSSLFDFQASGAVDGRTLRVTVDGRRSEIPLQGPIFLSAGILNGLKYDALAAGRPLTFNVFDPTTMAQRPVKVTLAGRETIEVTGQPTKTRKLTVEFAGASGLAWVDGTGRVVREQGLMGIELRRSTREAALASLKGAPAADLTEMVAVPVRVSLDDRQRLTMLRLRVTGIEKTAVLNGGRQQFADGILTVRRETVPAPGFLDTTGQQAYLCASALVQSDHPKIRAAAAAVVRPEDPPAEKVRKLVAWVNANIEKRPVVSVPNALEVLTRRMGDCNEHAVLLAALARAEGIPTRVEAGLVYLRGSFYYHAWNSVWLDRWVTADALMNQLPADVTHLRLVGGDLAGQIDLMGIIGKIGLEVVEKQTDPINEAPDSNGRLP